MKVILIILFFSAVGLPNGFEIPDTTKSKDQETNKEQLREQEKTGKPSKEDFIDKKGAGEHKRAAERKRKDVFIDKDGDGISDTRQGGMSFNKLRKRTGQKQGSGSGGGHNGGTNQFGPGGNR
jgi:hypothetical protein